MSAKATKAEKLLRQAADSGIGDEERDAFLKKARDLLDGNSDGDGSGDKPGPSQSSVFERFTEDEALMSRVIWRQERSEWWIKRDNGIWNAEDCEQVQGAIHSLVLDMPDWATGSGVTSSLLSGVKTLLRPALAKPPTAFDRGAWLLGVQNGIVDLEYGKLVENGEDDYITRVCNAPFDADAICPKWEDHILRLFKGDEEVAHCFHKFIGSALVGNAETDKPQVFGQLLGPSGGGKGTTSRVLQHILGTYSGNFRSENFVIGKDRHLQWMMRLNGVRLAIVQEMPTDGLNMAMLKSLSGGDIQTANEMRMNDVEWVPTHTLLFTSNNAPNFDDDPEGMYRRYVPLQTAKREEGVVASGRYEAALREEAAGILAWCILGTQLWLDEDDGKDFALPQSVIDQRDSHISGQSVYEQFVDEHFAFGDDTDEDWAGYYRCSRADVRTYFAGWLLTHGDTSPLAQNDKRLRKVYDVLDSKASAGQPTIGDRQQRGWTGAHLNEQ